ncbi:MAG: Protein involved in cellulose biosynthesis (CelD)-like protein [candidate division WWE3 bacterium GW2011_GWC1_47_10]|uniref:Protein involved in cellulose biosynthesis (CelD)-like protein n=1 Tax=candidate division WWE3 bacterium GW2011_GWC1_47_10 TaxID=1619122 RepID=A0A0G1TWC7_UNCKA|nr:MAG: Protein involved in cellulose biosynthesis (CelD)-like protein [candidate division WWE3 bacterium GW2011_GWC1_47_10]
MSLQIIKSASLFSKMKGQWNELYSELVFATPFQTWEWNFLYWEYFRGNKRLQIVKFEDNNRLVGILPLCIRCQDGLRILEPIGTRGTDYIHLLIKTASSVEILKRFVNWFDKNRFDLLNLEDIPETAPYLDVLIDTFRSNGLIVNYNKAYCPCYEIELPESWNDYLVSLSKRRKMDLEYHRRYALKHFSEVALIHRTVGEIKKHFELHQKARLSKNDVGTYTNQKVKEFMDEFARVTFDKGMLQIIFLSMDNVLTASILGIEDKNRRYNITIGYDPNYAKYSRGKEKIQRAYSRRAQ